MTKSFHSRIEEKTMSRVHYNEEMKPQTVKQVRDQDCQGYWCHSKYRVQVGPGLPKAEQFAILRGRTPPQEGLH